MLTNPHTTLSGGIAKFVNQQGDCWNYKIAYDL